MEKTIEPIRTNSIKEKNLPNNRAAAAAQQMMIGAMMASDQTSGNSKTTMAPALLAVMPCRRWQQNRRRLTIFPSQMKSATTTTIPRRRPILAPASSNQHWPTTTTQMRMPNWSCVANVNSCRPLANSFAILTHSHRKRCVGNRKYNEVFLAFFFLQFKFFLHFFSSWLPFLVPNVQAKCWARHSTVPTRKSFKKKFFFNKFKTFNF